MRQTRRQTRREWIDDHRRPGGIGRAERQRIFWERVAGGRQPTTNGAEGTRGDEFETESESPWESAQLAVVTLLTVMVFGLGWVTLELEGAIGIDASTGYAIAVMDPGSASVSSGSDFSKRPTTRRTATSTPETGF